MIDDRIEEGFIIDDVKEIEYDFKGIFAFVTIEFGKLFVK